MTIDMRTLRVDYGNADKKNGIVTIFVPLPRAAWLPLDRCDCQNCKGRPAWWDTMAIQRTPDKEDAHTTTWLVHRPDGHPFHDVETEFDGFFGQTPKRWWTKPDAVPFVAADVRQPGKPVAFAPRETGLNPIDDPVWGAPDLGEWDEGIDNRAARAAWQAAHEGKDSGR